MAIESADELENELEGEVTESPKGKKRLLLFAVIGLLRHLLDRSLFEPF